MNLSRRMSLWSGRVPELAQSRRDPAVTEPPRALQHAQPRPPCLHFQLGGEGLDCNCSPRAPHSPAPSWPCWERRDRHRNVWAQPMERTWWEQPFLKGSWNIPDLDLLSALGLRVWQKGITRLWPCPLLTAALTNTSQGLTQSLFKGNTIFPHKTFFKVYLNLFFSVTASLGNKHIKPLMICISKERHYSAIINTNQFKILPIFGEELQHSCKQNL